MESRAVAGNLLPSDEEGQGERGRKRERGREGKERKEVGTERVREKQESHRERTIAKSKQK